MKDDRLYLLHILECIGKVERYADGGREAFDGSEMAQDAVLRNLQVMAESVTRLSTELAGSYPELPVRSIRGFRNILVHDYLGIDLDAVWEVVQRDLPLLRRAAEAVLARLPEGGR